MSKKVNVSGGMASIEQTGLSEHSQRISSGGYSIVTENLVFTLAGSSGNLLVSTAHPLRKYDRIRFIDGDLIGMEFQVLTTPTANTFTVNYSFDDSELPGDGNLFDHMRAVSQRFDADGNVITSIPPKTIVDQMDDNGGVLTPSDTTIPRLTSDAVEVVASLAAACEKIITVEDVGEFMAIYEEANRTTLIAFLPLAGGTLEVSIAAGQAVFLGAVNDTDITTANTKFMMQFVG